MKQEGMINYHCKCIQGRKEKKRSGRKKTSPIILHARLLLWPLPVPHPGEKKEIVCGNNLYPRPKDHRGREMEKDIGRESR